MPPETAIDNPRLREFFDRVVAATGIDLQAVSRDRVITIIAAEMNSLDPKDELYKILAQAKIMLRTSKFP